jgi:hypothetical protein
VTPGSDVENELLRSYIDKLDRAHATASASESRLTASVIVVSAGLLALSAGVVSVDQKITISGIQFSMPLSTFLIAGTVLTFALSLLCWATTRRTALLQEEIETMYLRAGFRIDAPPDSDRNPWSSSGPIEVAVPGAESSEYRILKAADLISSWGVGLVILLLPTAAQVVATVRVSQALGGIAWLLLLLPILTLLQMAAMGEQSPSGAPVTPAGEDPASQSGSTDSTEGAT